MESRSQNSSAVVLNPHQMRGMPWRISAAPSVLARFFCSHGVRDDNYDVISIELVLFQVPRDLRRHPLVLLKLATEGVRIDRIVSIQEARYEFWSS